MALARTFGLIALTATVAVGLTARTASAQGTAINEQSKQTPALAEYNGALYIAWAGVGSHQYLNLASATSPLQNNFGPAHILENNGSDELTYTGPALAAYNGRLYVAWTSTDPNHTINLAYTTNGTSVSPPVAVGSNNTDHNPALTVYNGLLYLAWTGTDSNHHLNYATTSNGTTFSTPAILPNQSSHAAPTLAQGPSTLIYGWTGTDPVGTLNFEFGPGFDTHFVIPDMYANSPYGTALAWLPSTSQDFLVFTANDNEHHIEFMHCDFSNGNLKFNEATALPYYSNNGPAVALYSGSQGTQVYFAWTGTDPASTLNVFFAAP